MLRGTEKTEKLISGGASIRHPGVLMSAMEKSFLGAL